jgi:hypothetical protein
MPHIINLWKQPEIKIPYSRVNENRVLSHLTGKGLDMNTTTKYVSPKIEGKGEMDTQPRKYLSPYNKQARDFLTRHDITFRAQAHPVNECPLWCDGKHIHGKKYVCTFTRKNHEDLHIDFWNSFNDAQDNLVPVAYDVLSCIEKSDPGTFENFCGDFGYDTDSRKAEKTYNLVCESWKKISVFFTETELEELQEIQ